MLEYISKSLYLYADLKSFLGFGSDAAKLHGLFFDSTIFIEIAFVTEF